MAKGISVHVGVNEAQPSFDVSTLSGCENDAREMSKIAGAQGFAVKVLIDNAATFVAVKQAILDAADVLEAGDIFLCTFAGHGSFNPSANISDQFQDEKMLLHDCLLSDNYLRRKLWSKFKKGVRILGIADCCHSGTLMQSAPVGLGGGFGAVSGLGMRGASGAAVNARLRSRTRPSWTQITENDGELNRGITAKQRAKIRKGSHALQKLMDQEMQTTVGDDLKAKLITLAACGDQEFALDGEVNGAFTAELLKVWENGEFKNYTEFMTQIQVPFNFDGSRQHPVIQTGDAGDEFKEQKPFTI